MATTDTGDKPTTNSVRRELAPLKGMCFGAIVMILIQYGLGMWVNLFGHLPASDHGRGFFAAFGHAVADGPAGLGIHAIFGVLLGVTAIQSFVRGIQSRRRVLMWMTVVGLAAVVVAGLGGIFFVSDQQNGNSFAMAISAGVGVFAYAVGLMSLSFA